MLLLQNLVVYQLLNDELGQVEGVEEGVQEMSILVPKS